MNSKLIIEQTDHALVLTLVNNEGQAIYEKGFSGCNWNISELNERLITAALQGGATPALVDKEEQDTMWQDGYNQGFEEGHGQGYEDGFSQGAEEGYNRGYAAGADNSGKTIGETYPA